jgi:hypothetical protein
MAGLKSLRKPKGDLLYICCQKPKFRKELLKHADSELVKCICQGASKVLDGTLPITSGDKRKLSKYKKTLRQLKQSKKSAASKKKVIVQTGGGFLLSLIPAVVGALASLIGRR